MLFVIKSAFRVFFVLLVAMFLSGFVSARAQAGSHPATGNTLGSSVSQFVNPDGMLQLSASYNGPLDISGYNISLDPARGPIFSPLMTSTTWNVVGGGVDDAVHTIVISGTDVYIGGSFFEAGGNPNANSIAKWNGSSWSSLANGLNGTVYAIAVSGADLYAGGYFYDVDGNANISYIAKWNGSSWSALGTGLNHFVYAIAVSGTNVYAGGWFSEAGGDPNANYVAKWNGSSWSALGSGLLGPVNAIAVSGTDVYVGGNFDNAGGNASADYIAKWNGSSWSPLDSGLNDTVYAITVSGTDLYVGGVFDNAGGDTNADFIAKWNGSSWSALGSGLTDTVYAITVSGTDIYAGGWFTEVGGDPTISYIAKWDGATWSALYGLGDRVKAIGVSGTDIYAGGFFDDAGGHAAADYFAKFGSDLTAPVVDFSVRTGGDTTSGDSVDFVVKFSELVTGVDATDFTLTTTGVSGASITGVSNENPLYTVTINTGSGDGTIRLDVVDNDTIEDLAGNPLGGAGAGNGNFTSGDTYGIDKTAPDTQIVLQPPNPSNSFSATFDFSSTEDQVFFECSLDGSAYDSCNQPMDYTGLVDGPHTFGVRARDLFDHVDATPASYSWTISATTTTFKSTGAQDGWVLESSETSNAGGTLNSKATTINIGDDKTRKQYRSILSFNTSGLPDNAMIDSITLKVMKQGIVGGGNPVTTFQGFMVDLKKGFFGTSALQITDFQTKPTKTYGPFIPSLVSNWYSIDLTISKLYINIGGVTQIRLRFKRDDNNNAAANYIKIYSGNAGAAQRPQLIIIYHTQ